MYCLKYLFVTIFQRSYIRNNQLVFIKTFKKEREDGIVPPDGWVAWFILYYYII
jgi:hypothetical protein